MKLSDKVACPLFLWRRRKLLRKLYLCNDKKGAQEGSSLRYLMGISGAIIGPDFGMINKAQKYKEYHDKRKSN